MYHSRSSQEGFTLVEIMVVVVIIGLLVALAVPTWQKIRLTSITNVMDNDARQLGSAAQQYFMEYGATAVSVDYAAGIITGPLSDRVRLIGVQYAPFSISLTPEGTFSLQHAFLPAPRVYDSEGHPQL